MVFIIESHRRITINNTKFKTCKDQYLAGFFYLGMYLCQKETLSLINKTPVFTGDAMARDEELKRQWDEVVTLISNRFADGDELDLDAIIYIIGIQELGKINTSFEKDDKINLMHIAICRLLEPFGYYEFDYFDEEGWPHYTVLEKLPLLKAGEQSVLMKEAVVQYFVDKEVI